MIECFISINGNAFQLLAKGHAGYAEPGRDIVCAGISSLTSAFANYAGRLSDYGVIDSMLVQDDGNMLHIFLDSRGNPAVNAAIDTLYNMLLQLSTQYPDYVSLELIGS